MGYTDLRQRPLVGLLLMAVISTAELHENYRGVTDEVTAWDPQRLSRRDVTEAKKNGQQLMLPFRSIFSLQSVLFCKITKTGV